jgi:hypothetical protein
MRGLLPEERLMLENSRVKCCGQPLSPAQRATLLFDENKIRILNLLIAQHRLRREICTCGLAHPVITAEGVQALLYDHLSRNTPTIT